MQEKYEKLVEVVINKLKYMEQCTTGDYENEKLINVIRVYSIFDDIADYLELNGHFENDDSIATYHTFLINQINNLSKIILMDFKVSKGTKLYNDVEECIHVMNNCRLHIEAVRDE